MTRKYVFLMLCAIVLFGFLIRVYRLPDIPSGFFADEGSIGYNAYSILTKGTDEHGISFPIFFQAFGEFKNPIEIYSTIPFITFFGLNEFSVRLTSVFYGLLSIFSIFLLTKQLFKKYKHNSSIALLSSFFLAISPWHIHFSRVSFEGFMPFILFTTLGLYFFLRFRINIRMLYLSTTAFALAIYSYFPARIFIPLFCLSITIIYAKFLLKNKKVAVLNFLILLFLLTPLIQFTFSPSGFARWNQINIFSQPPEKGTIFNHIRNNYFSHFSLDFLFLKGDIDMPGQFITRHSVRDIGELHQFQLPIIILGFAYLIIKRELKILSLLGIWLAFYPVGSMLTTDTSAQATRSIIGVVPFQVISSIGLYYLIVLFSKIRKSFAYVFVFIILTIISASFISYLNLYFVRYPQYSSDFWGWQHGPKEIVSYFIKNRSSYDQLYMSGEFNGSHIFLKFYDPKNQCNNKCILGDFYSNPNLINPLQRQLFSMSPDYLSRSKFSDKFLTKKVIYYPNGNIAFYIGEIVQ